MIAKARVAQLIGFRSITAAAGRPVTFGGCSSWWKARLLAWWGSSAARGDGVTGTGLVFVGAGHWTARCVWLRARAGEDTRPYTDTGTVPFLS